MRMSANIRLDIHNRFDLVLTDATTGAIKQTAKAENLVCDTFLPYCAMGDIIVSSYNRNQPGMRSIVLGTGTGTPSVTDRVLFNMLVAYYGIPTSPGWTQKRLNENTYSFTATVTADENTANGLLTEIGLGESHAYSSTDYGWSTSSSTGIYTHALFTDSEGNPITIKKTNADRLTITATIYGTVVPNNTNNSVYAFINSRNITSSKIACDPRIPYVDGDGVYTSTFTNSILGSLPNSMTQNIYGYPVSLPIYSVASCLSLGQSTSSKDVSTYTARATTTSRILANQQNYTYPTTVMVKSFSCDGIKVILPNASVYPPKQLTLSRIADGETTDFNFGVPELMVNDVEVYIDNVRQNSNTYTFNGRDYTHIQGWKSYDSLYLDNFDYTAIRYTSSVGNNDDKLLLPLPFNIGYYYSNIPTASEVGVFMYDFKSNYTVSAVGKYIPAGVSSSNPAVAVPKLYYSNDKVSWTEVTGLWESVSAYINAPQISDENPYIQISPISARYWKVENPAIKSRIYGDSSGNPVTRELSCSIAFDNPKPQLKFNTPPPANSTITIKAYCEYPIKNSNWIVEPGMTFDLTIARTS